MKRIKAACITQTVCFSNHDGDTSEYAKKMICQRKQQRLAQGKKCTATDTKYFQIAEKLLYEELGTAIGKPKQEIANTIVEHIGQNSV